MSNERINQENVASKQSFISFYDLFDLLKMKLKKTPKILGVFFLGTGKVISSAALLQQNLQGTLAEFPLNSSIVLVLSITSAGCNTITNAATRYTSISNFLFSDPEDLSSEGNLLFFLYDGHLKIHEKLIAWPIKFLGRASMFFMALNTQNAVQELLYYYFHGKNNTFIPFPWRDEWLIALTAGTITLSSLISYKTFNLPRIDRNAESLSTLLTKNFIGKLRAIKPLILYPLIGMSLLNIPPTLAGNYYSTQKALTNLMGSTREESWYIQSLLYASLVAGFSSNIFSIVGESFRFLTDHKKSQRMKYWFTKSPLTTLLVISLILPVIGDILANTFGNYIGSTSLFSDFFPKADEISQSIFGIISALIYGIFYTLYQEVPIFDSLADIKKSPSAIDIAALLNENSEYLELNEEVLQPNAFSSIPINDEESQLVRSDTPRSWYNSLGFFPRSNSSSTSSVAPSTSNETNLNKTRHCFF